MTVQDPGGLDAAIDRLARTPRLLVALDFDGTLAPLVDEPLTARMAPAAAAAVRALQDAPATDVAFVSGRSLGDLRLIAEHDDDSPIALAASHGAEWWRPGDGASTGAADPADEALRDELRAQVEQLLAAYPGVWVEPKAFGFGVHSRLVDAADAATVHAIADDLMSRRAPHWRRRVGHSITEYAFRDEGKDTAVAALRESTGATAVLFAGDDVTDEDALRSLGSDDVGIRVGAGETAAAFRVDDIDGVADLLDALARRRVAAQE